MGNDEVALRPAKLEDAPILQRWLDGPGGHWLDYTFGAEAMLDYYLEDEELHAAYIVVIGGVDAGIITLNKEDVKTTKAIDIDHFLIQKRFRGRGYGCRALKCLLASPAMPTDVSIRAGIKPTNEASIRCFTCAGFTPISRPTPGVFGFGMEYRHPKDAV